MSPSMRVTGPTDSICWPITAFEVESTTECGSHRRESSRAIGCHSAAGGCGELLTNERPWPEVSR